MKLCECGCGQPARKRFATQACIPRSVRQAAGRKGRKAWAYKRRAAAFRSDLARLDRQVSREDLLDVLMSVYKRAYNSGYQQGRLAHADGLAQAQIRGAA